MTAPDLTPVTADAPRAASGTHTVFVPALEPLIWPTVKSDGELFKMPLPPQKVWEYRLADGALYGVVARWDKPNGRGKTVLPCVYASIDGANPEWAWLGFGNEPGSRPLLGLIELGTKPMATVLVVEGEKTRDAAPRWMPEDWVCVTWQGGSKAVKYTNWEPLSGRRVVIWPDKDAPPIDPKTGQVQVDARSGKPKLPAGEQTALELVLKLNEVGARFAQVPVYGPTMGMLPNTGWDLADDPPEGFNPTEWMTKMAALIPEPKKTNGKAATPPGAPELPTEDEPVTYEDEYRCLGYSQEIDVPLFHIFSVRSGLIVTQSGKELGNRSGVYNIVPDDTYWREHLPYLKDAEKIPWHHIATVLMNKCYDAGYFKVDNERGRGAWLDDGRVVMHLGQSLLVDGQPISPAKMRSEYYYPIAANFFKPKGAPALSDDEGRIIRKICRSLRWENPFFAELLGGWIATAPICGAMAWRTHFWLQGEQGSGKTWIVNNFIRACFGSLAFYPMGSSTAAGIMGQLKRDARPVVFDEAEGKGDDGVRRRQMIIEMLRYSSSESGGEVVKGTAGHGTVSFRVQSQYFLSSIGVGLTEAADQTRTVVGTILRRATSDGSFAELQALVKSLPADLPERLLRRQLMNLRVIRKNADTMAAMIALRIGSRRIGDQIGTLMAGDYSLTTDKLLDDKKAEELVDMRLAQNKLEDFSKLNETKEDLDLVEHLVSSVVRVNTQYGYSVDRTLGELIETVAGRSDDPKLDREQATAGLRRLGMTFEIVEDKPGYWIGRHKTYIANDVMRRSQFAQGWDLVLKNHPQAIVSKAQKSFGGFKQHAIWLPLTVLSGDATPRRDEQAEMEV